MVPPAVEREVEEELAFHVDMRVRELVARGWTEDDARREAVARFGDIERVKGDCRTLGKGRDARMNRRLGWDEFLQDIRYAIRQLLRAPTFAAASVLTLALAIGAATAVFSVLHAVLLTPLPYPEPDRLAVVWTRYLPESGFDIDKFSLSGEEFLDFQEETRTFASLGALVSGSVALTGDGDMAERIRIGRLSLDVLQALDVAPLHGRWFTEAEDAPGASPTILLGYDVWTTRYGADPAVVGRTILVDGRPTEVLGVMPEGFAVPDGTRAFTPLGLDRSNAGGRASHGYSAIGRLRPGATMGDVAAELAVLNDRWAGQHEHNEAHFLWAQDLRTETVADAPRTLTLLMAAVGLLIFIACANVANLLLARGERRQAEVGLRTALGAGRGRIVRQLLTESLVLAGLGAVLGVVLAQLGTTALIAMDPSALPRLESVRIDGAVALFAVAAAVVTAIAFGTVPALLAGGRDAAGRGIRTVGSRGRSALRRGLVAGEVAMCLVVVVLAGLMARSLSSLANTDPGMDPANVLTFGVSLPSTSYEEAEDTPNEFGRLFERFAAIPGVTAVGAATAFPFSGGTARWDFELDDRPPRQDGDLAWNARVNLVSHDYFEALAIPILRGRDFRPSDGPDDALVGVISERMAATYWPGEDPIGKRWGYLNGPPEDPYVNWITVVGVAQEQYSYRVDEDVVPQVYMPLAQAGRSGYYWPRSLTIGLRTGVEPTALVPAVRRALADFDPDLPPADITTLEAEVRGSLAQPRLGTNLLGAFGVMALILAVVGIYGVVAYSVAGRTREIGVRVALGAERRDVMRLILREGARPLLSGALGGIAGAWFATRLVEGMLHGVSRTDPVTFVAVPAALMLVGLAASFVPALHATRVPPTEALRDE